MFMQLISVEWITKMYISVYFMAFNVHSIFIYYCLCCIRIHFYKHFIIIIHHVLVSTANTAIIINYKKQHIVTLSKREIGFNFSSFFVSRPQVATSKKVIILIYIHNTKIANSYIRRGNFVTSWQTRDTRLFLFARVQSRCIRAATIFIFIGNILISF